MPDSAGVPESSSAAKTVKSQRRSSFFNLRKGRNTVQEEPRNAGHNRQLSTDSNAAASVTTTVTTPPTSSYMSPSSINASIPTRTSSSNAVTNGDITATPRKSPHKHRSLGAVPEERRRFPEVNEQVWISQGRGSRMSAHQPSQSSPVVVDGGRSVGQDLIYGDGTAWSTEKENILRAPFDYLESHPGKDIRTQMINAFNAWLQVPPSSLDVITKVVTMLHTASLLIDDVEDNSQLRRGVPVAHNIFGIPQTINSSNYIYFCALQDLMTLDNPEVVRIYCDELVCLHRGQGMDLFWRDTLTCPTEDDYLEMVGNKTGGLFRLAIKLMCAESPSYRSAAATAAASSTSYVYPDPGSSESAAATAAAAREDYVPLVNTIGLLFQILDDYRNLSDTTYTENKGLCEDLTEGKFSFPVIHAIRADPSNLVLINILKQKTTDDEVKKYAVAYMDRAGSFSYTRRVLRGLTKKALTLVDQVDAGRGRAGEIRSILDRLRVDKSRDSRPV